MEYTTPTGSALTGKGEQMMPDRDMISKAEVLETYAELYDIFDDHPEIQSELHKVYDKIRQLDGQPELVMCKDCMYAHLTYDGECKYCDLDEDENGFVEATYRPGDWFCADGERRAD